jgi:hypothetical protein
MEQLPQTNSIAATAAARRNEDIAVDLLKVIIASTQVGRPSASATGFGVAPSPKAEDQVEAMLDLYRRCLAAIEGK